MNATMTHMEMVMLCLSVGDYETATKYERMVEREHRLPPTVSGALAMRSKMIASAEAALQYERVSSPEARAKREQRARYRDGPVKYSLQARLYDFKTAKAMAKATKAKAEADRAWRAKHNAEIKLRAARKAKALATREANRSSDMVWPLNKQRRSNVDWDAIYGDADVTRRQIRWERNATAKAMVETGLRGNEVGKRFGVGAHTVRSMVYAANRWTISPVEQHVQSLAKNTLENDFYQPRKLIGPIGVIAFAATAESKRVKRDWLYV